MKILLALFLATGALSAGDLTRQETDELLTRLVAAHRGQARQADFREEKHMSLMKKPIVENGTLTFIPPDKFRREVPGKSLSVCDGQTLWLYYPEFNEVEKYVLSSNRALQESLAAITSGFGMQDLEKTYEITARKLGDGFQLTLVPHSSRLRKSVSHINVELTPALTASGVEIFSTGGDLTVTTFFNDRKSTAKPTSFKFEPPQGATVSEPLK